MILRRFLQGAKQQQLREVFLNRRFANYPRSWYSQKNQATTPQKQPQLQSPKHRIKRVLDPPPLTKTTEGAQAKVEKTETTQSILRELFNDMVQLPIKYLAYRWAGPNGGPFLAELKRSSIDAINHFVLFLIDRYNTKPSSAYPYGMAKLKNFVCNFPAALFVISGIQTIFESLTSLGEGAAVHGDVSNSQSVWLYAISISVELFVIYRNITSANLIPPKEGGGLDYKKFFSNLSNIKSPLFQVILYENLVTITSTTVPLLCEGLHWLLPSWRYIFPIGTFSLGVIQIFVGAHLFKANIGYLVGDQAVEESLNKTIVGIVKGSKFADKVTEVTMVKTAPEQFRSSVEASVNKDYIRQSILEDNEEEILRVVHEPEVEKRIQLTKDLITQIVLTQLKKLEDEETKVELKTQEEMGCVDTDLDLNIEMESEQEVEKLVDSVQESHAYFRNNARLQEEIKNLLPEDVRERNHRPTTLK